jgi:hypothetical protein
MIVIRLTWIIENSIIPKIGSIRFLSIAMSDRREKIDRLLADVERESYARGWHAAIAELQAKAPEIAPIDPIADTRGNGGDVDSITRHRQRGRPEKAISLVKNEIFGEPGLRGVDIVRSLEKKGTPVVDRTVRSALRRLKGSKTVWQRNGRWYPKSKERHDAENEIGEALGTPPH